MHRPPCVPFLQGVRRVLCCQDDQVVLLTPLRFRDRHCRAFFLPQPAFQLFRHALRQGLAQDVPGDQARVLVILDHESGQDLARIFAALARQGKMIPSDHPSAPDIQDLHHGVQAVLCQRDQVLFTAVCSKCDLALHQAPDLLHFIADLRCLLISHFRRGFFHLFLKLFEHQLIIPVQEVQYAAHHFRVFRFRTFPGARRHAAAEFPVHAGTLRADRRKRLPAGAKRKHIPYGFNHLAYCVCADIRAKIFSTVPFHPAGDFQPRKRLTEIRFQVGIVLVVLKQYVVIRFMVFDQIAFEDQCFQVGFAQEDLKIVDVGDHGFHFGRMCGIPEIAPDAVLEIDRLPDIDHRAVPVLHQVTSGRIRQHADLLFEFFAPVFHRYFSALTSACSSSIPVCSVVWYSPVFIPVVR